MHAHPSVCFTSYHSLSIIIIRIPHPFPVHLIYHLVLYPSSNSCIALLYVLALRRFLVSLPVKPIKS